MSVSAAIMVPLDGSPLAERAVPYAVVLAQRLPANLLVVRAADALPLSESHGAAVQNVVTALKQSGISAELHEHILRFSGVAEVVRAILNDARERQVSMVVMSTHGRGGFGRLVMGSVADDVVRNAEMPVLLIPAAYDRAWPHNGALRLLVALDGSDVAEAALGPVRQLATRLPIELILVRAVEPTTTFGVVQAMAPSSNVGPSVGRIFTLPRDPAPQLDEAEGYLQDVAAEIGTLAKVVEARAEAGRAASVIAAAARANNVDVIAMATHGRSGAARAVLGSTTMEMLHRAVAPLLLVRPLHAEKHTTAPAEASTGEATTVALDAGERSVLEAGLRKLIFMQDNPEFADAAQHLLDKVHNEVPGTQKSQ